MEDELRKCMKVLESLGLSFWVAKLQECIDLVPISEAEAAQATLKLFGAFGTLNDNAFSDNDAPEGMSGEEATKLYFSAINRLHAVAEQSVT